MWSNRYANTSSKKSANIFVKRPDKTISETLPKMLHNKAESSKNCESIYNGYIVLGDKGSSPSDFWEGIVRRARPTVVLKESNNLTPLIDIFGEDAIKITSLKYSSPPMIDAQGIIGGLVDLAFAGGRNQRDEETFINEQIGQSADNVSRITRAYQIVSDHKTPPGVRSYAENMLQQIQEQQGRLNKLLGIRIDRIDTII